MRRLYSVIVATVVLVSAGCDPFSRDSKEADNPVGDNDPELVLALGDSVTAGSTLRGPSYPALVASYSGKQVINEGIGGALSSDGAERIAPLLTALKPGYVMILYGINDVIHVGNPDWTVANLRTMIEAARINQTIPIVGTIPPRYRGDDIFDPRHTALNEKIRAMLLDEDVRLVDIELVFNWDKGLLQADGFHPNAEGNQLIAVMFNTVLTDP